MIQACEVFCLFFQKNLPKNKNEAWITTPVDAPRQELFICGLESNVALSVLQQIIFLCEHFWWAIQLHTRPRTKVLSTMHMARNIMKSFMRNIMTIPRSIRARWRSLFVKTTAVGWYWQSFPYVWWDHGQGTFRVVFRDLLFRSMTRLAIYKTKAIAEVYCKKKREFCWMRYVVTSWLESDLQQTKDSQLIATPTEGKIFLVGK